MNSGEFGRLPFTRGGDGGNISVRRVRAYDDLLARIGLGGKLDGGEFGQQPFARDENNSVISTRRVDAYDELLTQAGVGDTTFRRVLSDDVFTVLVSLVPTHARAAPCMETFNSTAVMMLRAYRRAQARDDLAMAAILNDRYKRRALPSDALAVNVLLRKRSKRTAKASGSLVSFARMVKYAHRTITASDDMEGFVDVVSFTAKTDHINITIPPGGRLIFDTERFTALLMVNGITTNVYRYHAGDFATIDDSTTDVVISSGTGGALSGYITLLERYL